MDLLESAVDDIVSACARFNTMRVVACALQLNNVYTKKSTYNLCGDQVYHVNVKDIVKNKASKYGNLDQLKYLEQYDLLREKPYDYKRSTDNEEDDVYSRLILNVGTHVNIVITTFAAEYGHLDCLQYLFAHGCECVSDTAELALVRQQFECFKYIMETHNEYLSYIYSIAHPTRIAAWEKFNNH